jgi:AcrR family transcriptional regulator
MSPRTASAAGKPNRERFIRAARHRFATQGYAATTTREIVADAESSMGNLYFYFKDKEGILRAVLDEATREAARTVDAAIARVPPGPAQLAIAVIAGVESLLTEPELARIVFTEAPRSGLRADAIAPFAGRVQRYFAAAPDLLDGPAPDIAAAAWVGAIWQAVENQLDATPEPVPRELGRHLARWNLRATGLPPATIESALRDADAALVTPPIPPLTPNGANSHDHHH